MYLAKLIASLLRPVLHHPLMDLTEEDTLALLSSEFWVRPVYEELLHAASRFNLSQEAEHKRPTSNLVKIASHVKETVRDTRNQHDQHTTMTEWLGADCPVDYLNVWFPAHWAPLVFKELQDRETKHRSKHSLWFDAPPLPTDSKKLIHERTNARRSREMHFQLGAMDRAGNLPTFIGKLKVDWIDFPFDDILQQFTTLKEGILRGVFKQKAAGAWFGCRAEKAQITALLPGGGDLSSWRDHVDGMSHSWPKSCNLSLMQMGAVRAKTFHLHRKFTRARHMWVSLKPDWNLLYSHMYTDWPGIHTSEEINDRLFVNPGRNDNIHDIPAKVRWGSPAHTALLHQQQYMWQFIDAQVKPVKITMQQALIQYEANLREEEDEIEANKRPTGGRKRWKTQQAVYQLKDPVKQEQTLPEMDETTYAEMLQDL